MSIFSKLLGKKTAEGADETVRVGGMEDFISVTLTSCRIWLCSNVH